MERIIGIDPGLAALLDKASREEIDYGFVMDCLKAYKNSRVKLHHLLKIQALIRVKKGNLCFWEKVRSKTVFTRSASQHIVWAIIRFFRVGLSILQDNS